MVFIQKAGNVHVSPSTSHHGLFLSSSSFFVPFFFYFKVYSRVFFQIQMEKNKIKYKKKSMVHFHDVKIHRNRKLKCQFPSQIRSQLEK